MVVYVPLASGGDHRQERQLRRKRSNMKRMQKDPDMLEEYDFSEGIQGKYAKKYAEGTNIVVIEPDVAKIFPDHDSVNQALRSLAEIIKRQKKLA
jgi:hypothetical protein